MEERKSIFSENVYRIIKNNSHNIIKIRNFETYKNYIYGK